MKNRKSIVCLDPGHDSQWANPSPVVPAYFEGQRMWDLAQLLASRLEDRGIEVWLTRQQVNEALDLVLRGQRSRGADLFLSLHSNAAANAQPDWVLVLHQVENGGTVDEQSREFAQRLAPKIGEVMGVGHQVYSVRSASDRDGNGYPDDYYGVLRGAQMVGTAGVIIEHGFHTNEKCARWLLEDSNLERIAEAEAEVIAGWLGLESPEPEKKWYRIRRRWEDAAGQIGAYRKPENAIAACPGGYTVYDWKGNAIYPQAEAYSREQFVRQLQAAIGAAVDGIAGPETLSKTPTISAVKNNRHGAVLPVQKWLFALGYRQVGQADGIAGPLFTAAVLAYQRDNGCAEDGEITGGQRTWQKLLGSG